MYTYLEDFKKHGINAQPYFVMTMFDELLFHKGFLFSYLSNSIGLALLRGDIIDFKLNKQEAQHVFDTTKRLLLEPDLYNRFVYKFNHSPQEFDYNQFSKHFEISQ